MQAWNKAARLFGAAGQPPPLVDFIGESPAAGTGGTGLETVVPGPNGVKQIQIGPVEIRALAAPRRSDRFKTACESLLHEWVHVFQNDDLFANQDPNLRETAAVRFAGYWGRRLFGAFPNTPTRGDLAALAAAYGPDYWKGAQFAQHYGKNPTTIPYPGAQPGAQGRASRQLPVKSYTRNGRPVHSYRRGAARRRQRRVQWALRGRRMASKMLSDGR